MACLSVQFLVIKINDNTTHDYSEACNITRLCLMLLQAESEPITRGIITQIAHLAML